MHPTPTHTTSQNHSKDTVARRSEIVLKSLLKLAHNPGCCPEKAEAVVMKSWEAY
jgi:hypothetical protein